jgi:hypothetical protein
MNPFSKMIHKIETKSEHDLIKAIAGLIVGFVAAKIVDRAYDSAMGLKEDAATTQTES